MASAPKNTPDDSRTWTIADLSSEFGVTARALRFYEEKGLLSPERKGTQRIYSARDRARLHWLERAKSVGFSLNEAGEMLDLYDIGDGRRTQRQITVERCREQRSKLQRQRDDIDWAIQVLDDFIDEVESKMTPKTEED
ncbi:MerR family transcriptional regulator [Croceicoccus naphthovorans]|uniref:Transcriptional regulator n=1 Tax=Croceicoccus naphthovorans TaxID=1348774 RepID=A0A0G3XHJ6_9SPHN|nr:MerR family DNA-binding transcriptional regulator [Croceicoccus naphthovorans]AKM10064.1 transcriptional regulator [Croceicoccus naphthovorans]MBB3991220.1 DNA-binding transcriptional MerR regulator [Croceicoccus naphthovorans]